MHPLIYSYSARAATLTLASGLLLSTCAMAAPEQYHAAEPPVTIAVMTDLHLLDPSLCTPGQAIERAMAADRKLITEGPELFDQASSELKLRQPRVLIISGDLTKDGERESHFYLACRLARLKAAGIQTFVVPGNHDISNAMSRKYDGAAEFPVPTTSPQDFADIYHEFGYGTDSDRDPASLSYAVPITPRLFLIGLDTCRYQENRPKKASIVGGMVRKSTLIWLKGVLDKAREKKMTPIVFMHHSLFEHFPGQKNAYPQYMLQNAQKLAEILAAGDVHYVFTGHFHANDITMQKVDGRKIFDIETGALITWPCSYRIVVLQHDGRISISTCNINAIPSKMAGFQEYAQKLTYERIKAIAAARARAWTFSQRDAEIAGGIVADAYLAHYHGDESTYKQLSDSSLSMNIKNTVLFRFRRSYYEGLKSDFPPGDLNVELDFNQ